MIDRRTFVCTAACGLLVVSFNLKARAPGTRIARIGYLSSHSETAGKSYVDAFRQGLRALGYVEGHNVVIEYRWADGNYDRLPTLAKELVDLNVDLLVSVGGAPSARAAKAASKFIPIVFVSGGVVQSGIVSSLARPDGNATGLEVLAEDLDNKRLELLKEVLPKAGRIAVLWNPVNPEGDAQRRQLDAAAPATRVKLRYFGARNPAELQSGLNDIQRERFDALLVSTDPMFSSEAGRIVKWAAAARLPAIYFSRNFADGFMIFGPDFAAIYRHAATYVDKILKGARPADLPVEQPTKFELLINLKTAKTLGLTIPQTVLARADEVVQ